MSGKSDRSWALYGRVEAEGKWPATDWHLLRDALGADDAIEQMNKGNAYSEAHGVHLQYQAVSSEMGVGELIGQPKGAT